MSSPLAWVKTEPRRRSGSVAEGPGGVFVFGTHEEGGSETWEALTFPCEEKAQRGAG